MPNNSKSASGDASPATETTSLLGNDTQASSSSSITSTPNGALESNGLSSGAKIGNRDEEGGSDKEVGEAEQAENPLFKGNPEMLAKMHYLLPAIAIGVRVLPHSSVVILWLWSFVFDSALFCLGIHFVGFMLRRRSTGTELYADHAFQLGYIECRRSNSCRE
jgi:hypothetical protein